MAGYEILNVMQIFGVIFLLYEDCLMQIRDSGKKLTGLFLVMLLLFWDRCTKAPIQQEY